MDYEELKLRVSMGEEFQFYYQGESYWISRNQEGYYLTRVKDSNSQAFKSANELFENGRIEGETILALWNELDF